MRHCPLALQLLVVASMLSMAAAIARAESAPRYRQPVGVYAHVSIETAINDVQSAGTLSPCDLRAALRRLYKRLLANPAISGIEAGRHWDNIQVADPLCVFTRSCPAGTVDGYDWDDLDDLFAEASAAGKTVKPVFAFDDTSSPLAFQPDGTNVTSSDMQATQNPNGFFPNIHIFSYLGPDPGIAQRVVNETAAVVEYLNSLPR